MSDIMDSSVRWIDVGSSLSYALDVFGKTRLVFVPITVNYRIVSSLSIHNVQRFILSTSARIYPSKLDRPTKDLASPIVALESDKSLEKILASMVQNNIRNIGIRNPEKDDNWITGIINDRKVLEFLVSHSGRRIISEAGIEGLYDIKVTELDQLFLRIIEPDLTALKIAGLISDVCNLCLLIKSDDMRSNLATNIVTPWDIVMKGFYHT